MHVYANDNSIRGLLDRNKSEEHPQSSNESIETKTRQKTTKERETDHKKPCLFIQRLFFFLTVPCCSRYFTWASHHDQSFYSTLFTYLKQYTPTWCLTVGVTRVQIRAGQISIGMYQSKSLNSIGLGMYQSKSFKFNRLCTNQNIIFFTQHSPVKAMRRQSSKFTRHTTKDATFGKQAFRGEDQKSYSWRQKWATGWPSSTSPTRLRGSSKSQIQ